MYILRWDDKALSYSRMRELFIQAFQSFVPDIKKLGLHSLRSGGATTCVNLGILHIHTIVPSAEIKEWVKPIFIYFSSCENNELKSYKFNDVSFSTIGSA
jgi:hypothetical protein